MAQFNVVSQHLPGRTEKYVSIAGVSARIKSGTSKIQVRSIINYAKLFSSHYVKYALS